MKLVEILARELKEWPATTACFAQDEYEGDIYNYVSTCIVRDRGEWNGVDDEYLDNSFDCPELYGQDLASDHATAIVTREMWENERSSWQENQGTQPAETHDKEIQIETRRGNVSIVSANSQDWTLRQIAEDVVCYRLIGEK